jgi:hypothetical protein
MTAVRALAIALAGLLASATPADEFDAGGVTVHYTALSTMQLTPAVASAYGIARSPNRGLLNVAVLRNESGRSFGTPVPAQVLVTAVNTLGQFKPIAMRRVDEPPAIYFLGEVTVADQETVTFEIQVTPEGAKAPIRLRLQHQFFAR